LPGRDLQECHRPHSLHGAEQVDWCTRGHGIHTEEEVVSVSQQWVPILISGLREELF
jgi:hypothetical protein